MERPALPPTDPDQGRVNGGGEPQEHTHEIDPDSMLHANLSRLLWSWVCRDEDAAKEAEESGPQDEENPVPAKRPVALEEWDAVDDDSEG